MAPEFLQASVPLIPKGDGLGPFEQRPITVLCVQHRCWAKVRFNHLREWQRSWVDDSLYGGVEQREAMEAILAFALDPEDAQLSAQPWYAAFLDYQKYFDTIAWEALWPLAEHWGLPHGMIRSCTFFCIAGCPPASKLRDIIPTLSGTTLLPRVVRWL